jgi:hypothetical protein
VGRLIRKLGKPELLRVCYEAGPTGYVLYWQLSELGVRKGPLDSLTDVRVQH